MTKIISIGNQKGGVGKTSSVINIGDALGRLNKKVLIIDADPQANSTASMLKDMGLRDNFSLTKALENPQIEESNFSSMTCDTNNLNVDIIPNSLYCMEWERKIINNADSVLGFQRLLNNDNNLNNYDFIIIDTPPNIGVMVNNSLMISDYVIVPIPVSDQYAIDGFSTFISLIQQINTQNKKLKLLGVLLTKFDSRSPTYKKNKDKIKAFFLSKKINVFETIIRINVDIDKAASRRKTIFDVNKSCPGAIDYSNLAEEIIKIV